MSDGAAGGPLALAGWSVRALAEDARRAGFVPLALDLFGDVDTLRACDGHWHPIGDAACLHLDHDALLAGLRDAAARGAVGWIAGSGFDGRADLLDAGAAVLPLLGTPAAALRRLRDARVFFAWLDAHGVRHPPVAFEQPPDGGDWLVKDPLGTGGAHVRPLARGDAALPDACYAQRRWPGTPMSATFVADGRAAVVLGFNRQIVRPLGDAPFVFRGAVGPLALADAVAGPLRQALDRMVPAFGLVGLGSLDFLLDDTGEAARCAVLDVSARCAVLEVNARAPATQALYPGAVGAHVAACAGDLRPARALASAAAGGPVRGFEIVFALHRHSLRPDSAQALQALDGCGDLPHAGAEVPAGSPLCTVEAVGAEAAAVVQRLAERRGHVFQLLEGLAP